MLCFLFKKLSVFPPDYDRCGFLDLPRVYLEHVGGMCEMWSQHYPGDIERLNLLTFVYLPGRFVIDSDSDMEAKEVEVRRVTDGYERAIYQNLGCLETFDTFLTSVRYPHDHAQLNQAIFGLRFAWLLTKFPEGSEHVSDVWIEAASVQYASITEEAYNLSESWKKKREAHGEIDTQHPGYLGSQDTYYVGTMKGVGRIYQQTFVDTYSRVADAKLYTEKTAITAADMLNDRVVPFFEEENVPLLRVLTDRGTEFCGKVENHAYQLYLAIENIDHSRTKAFTPQTNGICERFHKTLKNEFYDTAFRKKLYTSLEELQNDLDQWMRFYNNERPHSGKYCYGKTPMQTFQDAKHIAQEKNLSNLPVQQDLSYSQPLAA